MRWDLARSRRARSDCQQNSPRSARRLVGNVDGENLIARRDSMRSAPKKYNTLYKKAHVERDMYLPRLDPKGVIQCRGCGAFHHRRHWTLTPPPGLSSQMHSHPVFCPACRKIQDNFPGGELTLRGVEGENRQEIARILRNEESQAR